MGDALQGGDRDAERVARLRELRGDRHRLLDEADQRRTGQQPPFIQCALVFGERLGATGHNCPSVGGGVHPRHRQLADVVDSRRPRRKGQLHDLVAVTDHDVIGDRSGRDQPDPGHAVLLGVQAHQLRAVDHIGIDGAQPGQQPGGADMIYPRHRGQRAADLLGDQRQIDQRRSVAADRLGKCHRRGAHGAQTFPQVLVESGLLCGADGFDRAAGAEEVSVGRLSGLMIFGQAVVQPA